MKRLLPLGPLLLTVVIVILTILKYNFLRGLGWDPIKRPTFDWPSGLALGKAGWVMTTTFIASGLLMTLLASRLFLDLKSVSSSKAGSVLLAFSGLALAGLAFTTDPTIRSTPATWHGQLHDLSFVLLGLSLLPSMIAFGFAFRTDKRWQSLSLYTWITVAFAIPTFILKGGAFYIFLFSVLLWVELISLRLVRVGR